jgi:Fe-S cluster assembly ATPase SufC
MRVIHYVEIENFKSFGKKIHIDIAHPAVLIGPNNSGKTSVIQAISLWSRGIKSWYDKKGDKESTERNSAGLNRLNLLEVPVAEASFLWTDTHVRRGSNTNILISVTMGIEHEGRVKRCGVLFTYRDAEVLYCKPDAETLKDVELIKFACSVQFHLLYPMSGIMSNISQETEETPLPDGRISLLLGQGQTAQVLRNLCYKVIEQDDKNKTNDWAKITDIMKRLFLIELGKPQFNETRGSLVLSYKQKPATNTFDIALAGRGLQQILLILAYLYWHKSSILLIDEPDAHLEILRQRQIYTILNTVIHENSGQVIIATHSEAILEEALETNLTLLLQGEAVNLAKQQDIKNTLRTYGIEHYYKAKVHPRILYIEGSTDVEILRALAEKTCNEQAMDILLNTLNVYYTQNIEPENSLDNNLERLSGAFGSYKVHFHTLKNFIPNLKGFALFDGDNIQRENIIEDKLAILYWNNYEIENYFITPEVLLEYAKSIFNTEDLFQNDNIKLFEDTLTEVLLEVVFYNDVNQLNEYKMASSGLKRTLLKSIKMSGFAEKVFGRFADKSRQPVLLTKGDYYRLIPFCPEKEIPAEVKEKLDCLVKYLKLS